MSRHESYRQLASIEARAHQLLAQAQWLVSTSPDRTAILDRLFGTDGIYLTLFPTSADRSVLRSMPARRQLFAVLSIASTSAPP